METITNKLCEKCDGTGTMTVAVGPDDYDFEFCTCPKGRALELKNDQ